jgi:ribosome recycling factor
MIFDMVQSSIAPVLLSRPVFKVLHTTPMEKGSNVAMTTDLFADAERRMQKAVEALKLDLAAIRTGRASSALVERIQVDYYGTPTPLNQVASISVPEPRQLVIQPWDRKMLVDIEKAIQKSDLGINPNNDGQIIRLNIPPMNEERRRDLVKTLHRKLDEHKIAIRNIRRDVQDKLRDREKKKEVSEDELKRSTERLQKLTDRYIDEMDKVGKSKELEILEV